MIFARADFVNVCHVRRIIIWFCDVGAQPQTKVEIGGFVLTNRSDQTNFAQLFGLFYLGKEAK